MRKSLPNTMTSLKINFFLIGISKGNVLAVYMIVLMEISVRNVGKV